MAEQILPVWRDHRGDGPVRCFPAGAATPDQVQAAEEGARARLVELVGDRQAGPIQAYVFGPGQEQTTRDGVVMCGLIGIALEPQLLAFLDSELTNCSLVLAMCPTDRISRRTPPRRKGRRR